MDNPQTQAAVSRPSRPDPEAPDPPVADLAPMMSAFQSLMAGHSHVRSVVAHSLGIGVSDLRALIFMSGADDVTPKQVGAFLELTSGAVTNLVDRMTEAGLIHRAPHPHDRRSVVLTLAPRGTESVSRVMELYQRAFSRALTPDQLPLAANILSTLATSLVGAVDDDTSRSVAAGGDATTSASVSAG